MLRLTYAGAPRSVGPPAPARNDFDPVQGLTDDRLVKTPAADIDVDHQLVARLVEEQHPDLAGALELVANGWDNVLYRLGDDLCVRLPRRQVAVDLLVNEQRWLPVLAQQITARIPVPVRRGVPSPDYPWPWTIGRWFDGRPATEVTPAERSGIAAELARFMTELHTPAPSDAPRSPVRGVPLAVRDADVRVRLASGVIPNSDVLLSLWDELVATPPLAGPPTWVHGDPHPANVLLRPEPGTGEERLSAVIDFGDLNGGDPATDLAAAWMVFDAEGRAAFKARLDELTDTDKDTWTRARGWALNLGSSLAEHSDDNPPMAAIGRHVLEQLLLEA
jgi:aminoglycoside phosphotransferase (APT) family kinase protein